MDGQRPKLSAELFDKTTHELVSEQELRQQFVRHMNSDQPEWSVGHAEMTISHAELFDCSSFDVQTDRFFLVDDQDKFRTPDAQLASAEPNKLIWNASIKYQLQTELKLMLCRTVDEPGLEHVDCRVRDDGSIIVGRVQMLVEQTSESVCLAIRAANGDRIGNLFVNVSVHANKPDGWVQSLDECMSGLETIRVRLIDRYENFLREERAERHRNGGGNDDDDDDDDFMFECGESQSPLMQNIFRELENVNGNVSEASTNGNCDKTDD